VALKYLDGRHPVAPPWKENTPDQSDNDDMVLRRLCNTEKGLLKNPEIAAAYSENITQDFEKGYIRKIDPTEENPQEYGTCHTFRCKTGQSHNKDSHRI